MSTRNERCYLCIDLKSFYASVECVERGLDPMTTNLVVADPTRTDKTICLAISPAMKNLGVKNRCRVFEIPRDLQYIMAPPRLQKYIDYSAEIYGVYLSYISKDDIYVYSIDECFLDVTSYLKLYDKTPKEMAVMLMDAVYEKTGVRATAGVGTNLFLAKIALDITAKHSPDYIGVLDERSYRESLWEHRPISDFWRIGSGTAKRLEKYGIYTMRQITEADEDLMHRVFGIDAELLIDHAWGEEPTGIDLIKKHKPRTNSISRGQVLMRDYTHDEARLIVKEMTELISLEMVERNVVTESFTLYIVYTRRSEEEPARGSMSLDFPTNVSSIIVPKMAQLYDRIADEDIMVRKIYVNCNNIREDTGTRQLNIFEVMEEKNLSKELNMQKTINEIKHKFGKNAMLKGMDLYGAATTLERNTQIGGHSSGADSPQETRKGTGLPPKTRKGAGLKPELQKSAGKETDRNSSPQNGRKSESTLKKLASSTALQSGSKIMTTEKNLSTSCALRSEQKIENPENEKTLIVSSTESQKEQRYGSSEKEKSADTDKPCVNAHIKNSGSTDTTDVMNIRRPPSKYPKMSIEDRAKQFGAFDPLTGLAEALRKKESEIQN